MHMKKTHKIRVGRFEVTGHYEPVRIEHDGAWGMRNEDLERLELEAAIKVFSQPDLINGDEATLRSQSDGPTAAGHRCLTRRLSRHSVSLGDRRRAHSAPNATRRLASP